MDRLEFYLGEWEHTENYLKIATSPNDATNAGIYTSKLGPGGNSLVNTFHSQGPVGDFEGMLVLTWDLGEKAYKAYVFRNESLGAVVETGAFEGEALVYHTEFTFGSKTLKSKNITRLLSAEKLESDIYVSTNDGPEKLLVHVSAMRKH